MRPQYLFAAIDARKARARKQSGGVANGRVGRTRYSADELKRLVVEASEAVVSFRDPSKDTTAAHS